MRPLFDNEEQLEAFLNKMGARRVAINNGVVEWDGQRFHDVRLEVYSSGIAYLSEGTDATGRKYPALSVFSETGVHLAIVSEILPRGRLARMLSKVWQFTKGL